MEYVALCVAGFALFFCVAQISRLQRRIEAQDKGAKVDDKLKKLMVLYDNIEGMLDSFEMYVEELRQDMERERGHLTELSRQASAMYAQLQNTQQPYAPPVETPVGSQQPSATSVSAAETKKESKLTDRERQQLAGLATKPQKVRLLMSRGFSLEEVARELNIGKGEVRLIADLDKS